LTSGLTVLTAEQAIYQVETNAGIQKSSLP
jgi:hypothetical protein